MPLETIAFLYPGAMGASLARTLHIRQPQLTLLTSLSARSQITLDRASSSGLINVPLEGLVDRADVIISILPPSAAIALATEVVAALPNRRRPPPIYIDANAISPTTVSHLSTLLAPAKVPFIDGAVLGLPATDTFDPKIYLSSAKEWEVHMKEVVQVLGGDGEGKGLRIEVLDGAGEGAASALKMCYGGINKGFTGLAALMVLGTSTNVEVSPELVRWAHGCMGPAAHAHSPGTADALLREFSLSQNVKLDGLTKSFPNMIGKAYRVRLPLFHFHRDWRIPFPRSGTAGEKC